MNHIVEVRCQGNQKCNIYRKEDPRASREQNNLGIMVCSPNRYDLGDIQTTTDNTDICTNCEKDRGYCQCVEFRPKIFKDARCILPLYIQDHCGIAMRTERDVEDPREWDLRQVGVIFTTPDRIKKFFGKEKPTDQKIKTILRAEVQEYDTYLRSCIWGYEILTVDICPAGEEHKMLEDSNGGFYNMADLIEHAEIGDWEIQ